MADSTRERLLAAALTLFSERGYKATTTRAIAAAAGVNEVTLFRHFGSKEAVLEAIIDEKLTLPEAVTTAWKQSLRYELEPDLLDLAQRFQGSLSEQRELLELIVREAPSNEALRQRFVPGPRRVLQALSDYLAEMKGRGELIDRDLEKVAIAFMMSQIGYTIAASRLGEGLPLPNREAFSKEIAAIFARGLSP